MRHTRADGTVSKMRWWVSKRQGTWRVFDMENLDVGMRITTLAGSIASLGVGEIQNIAQATNKLRDALLAIALQHDVAEADRKLQQIVAVKFPPRIEGLRLMTTGLVRIGQGRDKEAIDFLDRALDSHPDMPIIDLFKGIAYNHLSQWDKALKHLETYRDLLGDDANLCFELGESLRGVGRFPEAQTSYRKSLDYDPKHADAFVGLLRALGPADKKDDIGARFAKLDRLHENFQICAEDCRQARDGEALEQLALAMRKIDPKHESVDYYLVLAKAWTGKAGEAVPLFKAVLARQRDEGKRQEMVTAFLQAMVTADKAMEAYAAVPDAREAFRLLAAELKKSYRTDDLRNLVTLHGKKHADDALLPFYQGEVYVQDMRYALADKAFNAGMAKTPDRVTLEPFRPSRVLARYHTGQALSAYADIGPKYETFVQFANLCSQHKNLPLLQTLVDMHAKEYPDSTELVRYRIRLKVQQDQVAEGVNLFKEALKKPWADDKRKQLVSDFLFDMIDAGKALEAYGAAPDARQAFQNLAPDLLEQGRRDELRQLLDVHRQKDPGDLWLFYYTGESLLDEQAWDKAAQAFGEGMKKAPNDEERARFRSQYVYAMYKAGRGIEAYQQAGARNATFSQLANLLGFDKKGDDLAALVNAHRPNAPDDADLLFFDAQAKFLLKQPDEAIALFQKAYTKQALDYRRRDYVSQFVRAMHEANRGVEAYRLSPDQAFAFDTLARELLSQKKADDLEKLVTEHGQRAPDDRMYRFYLGELHLLRGTALEAERAFAAALAKSGRNDDWMFQSALNRARVKAGKAVAAYQELGLATRSFEDLAYLCIGDKNVAQLQALVDAHFKAHPDLPDAPAWELEIRWLKEDYEGALKLLTAHRQDLFAGVRHRWKCESYLVRCLVKLKRSEEAVREAETIVNKKHGNRVLLVLAHAATGDVKRTIAVLDKVRPQPYFLEDCYRDLDLGPILRSEPFATFRDRFPEPKERRGFER